MFFSLILQLYGPEFLRAARWVSTNTQQVTRGKHVTMFPVCIVQNVLYYK